MTIELPHGLYSGCKPFALLHDQSVKAEVADRLDEFTSQMGADIMESEIYDVFKEQDESSEQS